MDQRWCAETTEQRHVDGGGQVDQSVCRRKTTLSPVDPNKRSSQSIALVGIDGASELYVEATRALKSLDAIESLYTSSVDHMLMAEVRAPDGDSLGDVISDDSR